MFAVITSSMFRAANIREIHSDSCICECNEYICHVSANHDVCFAMEVFNLAVKDHCPDGRASVSINGLNIIHQLWYRKAILMCLLQVFYVVAFNQGYDCTWFHVDPENPPVEAGLKSIVLPIFCCLGMAVHLECP